MPFFGASKKASRKANESAALRTGFINTGFDRAEGFLAPLAQQGTGARQLLGDYLGLNGVGAQGNAFQDFRDSPNVAFLRDQGIGAIDRSAASRGMLNSGRTLSDLARFSTGLAEQSFGNRLSQIAALANQGAGAQTSLANLATGRANALSGIEGQRGLASQQAVLGAQNERIGALGAGLNLASFALGGGFNGGLNNLFGSQSTPDFRRVY